MSAAQSLGMTFALPSNMMPEDDFPRTNGFGMSNSAFHTEMLARCMPIPPAAVLVDWYLVDESLVLGARFAFGDRAEMDYRQHRTNIARVRAPFDGSRSRGYGASGVALRAGAGL